MSMATASVNPGSMPQIPVPVIDQSSIAARGNFYVGGCYSGAPDAQIMSGQIFVEVLVPKEIRRRYPLVLIHGAGQTAACWMQTPDGRKGWADFFVEQGYVVYLIDQPMRGRSASHPADGATRIFTVSQAEAQFSAGMAASAWPHARLHTQWPGEGPNKGCKGDPIFDAFYASVVETVLSDEKSSQRNQSAGAALLDRIGPAVLLTHSQAGPYGWLIADARPALVKGIVAVEPSGPPFNAIKGRPRRGLRWGVSDGALTYHPLVDRPADIETEADADSEDVDVAICELQKEPARQLMNLANIPVMLVTAEASYHAAYDHGTAKYLQQAGVRVDFVRLKDRGICGNGHMMMLEANNLEIARCLDEWVVTTVT